MFPIIRITYIYRRSVGLFVEHASYVHWFRRHCFRYILTTTSNLPSPRTITDTKFLIKIEQHRMIFRWLWQFRSNFPGNRMGFSVIFTPVYELAQQNHIPKISELILCSTYKLYSRSMYDDVTRADGRIPNNIPLLRHKTHANCRP